MALPYVLPTEKRSLSIRLKTMGAIAIASPIVLDPIDTSIPTATGIDKFITIAVAIGDTINRTCR